MRYVSVGNVYSRLTVLYKDTERSTKHATRWVCKCDCGNETSVVSAKLNNGNTKSCGCLNSEKRNIGLSIKHGLRKTPIYQSWANMKKRCDNKKSKEYDDYGGRGITYENSWSEFEEFYKDMGDCPDGFTLERVDVNGNYVKSNCKWESRTVQNHNRRKLPPKNVDCYSEFIGVSWNRKREKWHSKMVKGGIKLLNKMFNDELSAAIAYDDASELHYGDRPNKTENQNVAK